SRGRRADTRAQAMANLFRGAMNLLGGSDASGGAPDQGRLVGRSVEMDGRRYTVKRLIATGGFATVYTCQNAQSGSWFALKSQLASDTPSADAIKAELKLLRDCSHPHIIKYFASHSASRPGSQTKEFLMITELCSGGSVIDLLGAGSPLTIAQVANIVHGATAAIAYLHALPTPVTHRDMKVENLLFSSRGTVKLCDFGSATTEEYAPDDTWTAARRTHLEEEFQRATTPMYRAPEILDTYLGYHVGRAQDVWALGCVLFYLCYRTHPFEDSAKLRIIYAKYVVPEEPARYAPFRPLIDSTLRPDPRERPTAADLQQRLEALAVALDVRVDTAVPGIDTTALTGGEPVGDERRRLESAAGVPERREQQRSPEEMQQQQAVGGGAPAFTPFSQLRGQGLSMFRNLKEKSAAVMQTVQNTYGSKGPELVWLTSRIVIAPQQLESVPEPLAMQAEESLRAALAATRRPFKIVNLAHRRLRCEYAEAVADVTFPADGPGGQSAPMDALLSVAHAAGIYLRQQPADAFVVLLGTEVHSSLAALSLLVYHRLLPAPWAAIQLLQEKRPETPLLLPPSSHRLLDALHKSVQPDFAQSVMDTRLQLVELVVHNLPTFNNNRTGCRPQLMVYVGGTALWTPQPYEMTRVYEGAAERARVQFGLKKQLVYGDVCFALYHARMSSLTQRVHQIPMISFGLHTALVDKKTNSIELRKGDLDYAPADDQNVPEDIKVTLYFSHREAATRAPSAPGAPRGFYEYPGEIVAPRHVVSSAAEAEEIRERFEGGEEAAERMPECPAAPAAAVAAPPQPSSSSNDFFGSLAWDAAPAAAAAAATPPPPPPHRGTSLASSHAAPPAPAAAPSVADRFESMALDPHETPILGRQTSPNYSSLTDVRAEIDAEEEEEVDLLGIRNAPPRPKPSAAAAAATTSNLLFDPFDTASSAASSASKQPQTLDDLFGAPLLPAATSSSSSSSLQQQRDLDVLLGFGGGGGAAAAAAAPTTKANGADLFSFGGDLMGGGSGSSMHRNASAPSFAAGGGPRREEKKASTMTGGGGGGAFDPFADFLAANPAPASSAASTRSSTPSMQQQQAAARPNYSRSAFDALNATGMPAKPKSSANAFDDLLQSQGFSSSSGNAGAGKTIKDMRRADEIRDLTPEQIKIRDWTAGKEKNIRALLASLSEVLWADAPRWEQPSMANLLTANEVKKCFRRAAVVVHPDKQTGLPHAELAKAIMIELNEAWKAFEEAGSPSLG
ncbi:hypothetical protein PMAYCL1PPCAC_03809, partial [Pristionchus mayeri]